MYVFMDRGPGLEKSGIFKIGVWMEKKGLEMEILYINQLYVYCFRLRILK